MKLKNLIIIISILSLLMLSGCGEKQTCPDCGDGNPCTADSCSKDTNFECKHNPIPGCSNECGVPCSGPVGEYMEMKCDSTTKQCAADVKAGIKISTSALTNEMISMGTKFKVITTFNQPFNNAKDLFAFEVSASQFGTGISNVRIKKAELIGTDANRQTVTLGEKVINKYVWNTETTVEDGVNIDFATGENSGSFTNFKIRLSYDYTQTYGGNAQSKSALFEISLRGITFNWLKPDITPECPAVCDDGNEGTADICNAATDYFCVYQSVPGKCGNFVCDPTENQCTCANDCGPCSGDAGQYLTFTCQNRECKTMTKQGVMQQPTSITDDRNMNFFYLQNTYTYNSPFNVNNDKFKIDFSLYNKQEAVTGVKIVSAKILDVNKEVASLDIGETLNAIGSSFSKEIRVTTFAGHEAQKALSLKVYVEYQYTTAAGTELRKADFTKPLGNLVLMNPTLI